MSLALHKVIREEAQGGGSGHRDSTVVAAKRVVPHSPAAPSGPASDVVRARWCSTRPRRDRVPRPQGTPPRATWRLSGDLSTAEAFRKKLVPPYVQFITLYHAKWWSCCRWCYGRTKIPFTHLSERCWVICSICNVGTWSTPLFLAIYLPLVLVRTRLMGFWWVFTL